jgi:NitT/TauT family transport system permease protein
MIITRRDAWQSWVALIAFVVALVLPMTKSGSDYVLAGGANAVLVAVFVVIAIMAAIRPVAPVLVNVFLAAAVAAVAVWCLTLLPLVAGHAGLGYWALTIALWMMAWRLTTNLSLAEPSRTLAARLVHVAVPLLFGITVLFLWEVLVRGFAVSEVLLPPPSVVWARIVESRDLLWADFRQTFFKAVLAGFVIGSGSGFLAALVVDRVPFLKRGLLPVGNLVSALPIVGVAPIMVMWFGFDWPSKAAVVVVMTFFPMLVNTVAGLDAADATQRDLMRTYAADHRQTLAKLRLPAALPFIFNGLKINTTLALIGAIVAEFFGTPIVGMGFRISTAVGRLSLDMVWAEIAVAALAGSAFYGVMALVERASTFWHPSFRT